MLRSEMVKPKAKQRKIGRGVSLTEATWERVEEKAAANEGTISEVIENAITVYFSVGDDFRKTEDHLRKQGTVEFA